MYRCTKIFSGYSTCFRQWRAESHCSYMHGYALKFKATFEGDLDDKNWVVDFGSFKEVKTKLKFIFDHTTLIAEDDPQIELFTHLYTENIIQMRIVEHVGCEMFAKIVYDLLERYNTNRAKIISVECIENENNSAIYSVK